MSRRIPCVLSTFWPCLPALLLSAGLCVESQAQEHAITHVQLAKRGIASAVRTEHAAKSVKDESGNRERAGASTDVGNVDPTGGSANSPQTEDDEYVLRCPSLAFVPPADTTHQTESSDGNSLPQIAIPSLPADSETALVPQWQSSLTPQSTQQTQRADSVSNGSPVEVQKVIVPVYVRRPVRTRFRGLFGRLLGPALAPMTDGLTDTAWGLNATAASVQMLQDPLQKLSSPLGGLTQPLNGLAQPLTGLAQPITLLAQPITKLAQPIHELGTPLTDLSHSASSLGKPMGSLGNSITGLQRPLQGMQAPLEGLPRPLQGLATSLFGLQQPITGLQRPLTQLATPIAGLQEEMHALRGQIINLERTIVDIGRNVTLAIVFGSSIIAYAIWTHRKVPAAVAPTVTTMETHPQHAPDGTDHHTTIIHTHPAPKTGAAGEHGPGGTPGPSGEHGHGGTTPPPDDHNPPPPPPNIIQPPGE